MPRHAPSAADTSGGLGTVKLSLATAYSASPPPALGPPFTHANRFKVNKGMFFFYVYNFQIRKMKLTRVETILSPALKFFTPGPTSTTSPATSLTDPNKQSYPVMINP
ncbi:hypothetical protein Hanom_Chr11g01042421 [Helianthus anomalus]